MTQAGASAEQQTALEIVVGIDYSDAAEQALFQALALARSNPAATLHVLEVAEGHPPDRPKELSSQVDAFKEAAQQNLMSYVDERLATFAARAGAVDRARIRTAVDFGKPLDQLLRFIRQVSADLVIVGTHGRSGLPRLVMGSVAESLLRDAPCGVMVVRPARK